MVDTSARSPRAWTNSPALRHSLWAVASAVAAVLVVAGAALDPMIPLAVVIGAGSILIAAFRPKLFALIALIAIILTTALQTTFGTVGGYADEGVVILSLVSFCTRRLVTDRRLLMLPGTAWFLAFIAFGFVSSLAAGASVGNSLEALLLITKGLLFAFALAQLRWTTADLARIVQIGILAIVVIAITGVLNLVIPSAWSELVAGRPPYDGALGLPALTGPFQHPAAFGRFCAVLATAVVAYGLVVRRSVGNAVLIAVTAGFALLTFQVKSIVGLIATVGLLVMRFSRPIVIFIVISFGPIIGALVLPPLVELVGGDIELYILQDSARSALTYGSFEVANAHFPLGAGFGRYGSYTAGAQYSPEYVALGFPRIYGLGPGEDGMFLNDTQWPAIIGEAGWIGAVCFALGIVSMFLLLFRRISDAEVPLERWIRVTGVGWLVVLIVESFAAPVFVSAPSYPFVFAAVGVVVSLRDGSSRRRAPRERSADVAVSTRVS